MRAAQQTRVARKLRKGCQLDRLPARLALAMSFFVFTLAPMLFAQGSSEPVVIGQKVEIYSSTLQEKRQLLIAKPAGYEQGTDRYPVLYVLDGEDNFVQAVGITSFLANADRIPPMLVVAVASTDRTRDLTTPTKTEIEMRFQPHAGGADAFLQFISDELIPYIDGHYRTRPYKVLVGHSIGGLFAVHTLTSNPKLFNAYIVIDPTLSWNNEEELLQAEKLFKNTAELSSDLFLAATDERTPSHGTIQKLCGVLDQRTPKGFRWTFRQFSGETHVSVAHRSIYSGLDTIFSYWHLADPLKLYDEGGVEAIHRHYATGTQRYGYHRVTPAFTISLLVASLIDAERLDEAGSVLLGDRERYPPPWNQLEALARAYERRGDIAQAIRFYKLSLQENPRNDWAAKKLRELGAAVPAPPSH